LFWALFTVILGWFLATLDVSYWWFLGCFWLLSLEVMGGSFGLCVQALEFVFWMVVGGQGERDG